MTIEEFRVVDRQYRNGSPNLFALATSDRPASSLQFVEVENTLEVRLPDSYREFLCEFGGGEFGYSTIYSADPIGKWYLPNKVMEAKSYLPADLLPFSDDFAGGHYAFLIKNGTAGEHVFYWNSDGGTMRTEYETILEFIVHDAYGPA